MIRSAPDHSHGPLEPGQRLVPLRPFVLGGEVSFENLVVRDAVATMLIRGPIASGIHGLPPGTTVRLSTGE
jgi:hypothetical protein